MPITKAVDVSLNVFFSDEDVALESSLNAGDETGRSVEDHKMAIQRKFAFDG